MRSSLVLLLVALLATNAYAQTCSLSSSNLACAVVSGLFNSIAVGSGFTVAPTCSGSSCTGASIVSSQTVTIGSGLTAVSASLTASLNALVGNNFCTSPSNISITLSGTVTGSYTSNLGTTTLASIDVAAPTITLSTALLSTAIPVPGLTVPIPIPGLTYAGYVILTNVGVTSTGALTGSIGVGVCSSSTCTQSSNTFYLGLASINVQTPLVCPTIPPTAAPTVAPATVAPTAAPAVAPAKSSAAGMNTVQTALGAAALSTILYLA